MKKAGMMLVAGLLVTGALAQDVTSVNVVGFNKIAIGPGKLALVTLPFESFGDATFQNVIGTQLPSGSRAFIWNRVSKTYDTSLRGFGGWSGTNIIYRGDAFWLSNAGLTTNYVSLMGEVPADYNHSATTTVVNISATDAVGYAYPVDVVWTNTTLSAQLPSGGRLFYWHEATQSYSSYLKGFGGWSTPAGFTIPAGRGFWVTTTVPINWTEEAPYDL